MGQPGLPELKAETGPGPDRADCRPGRRLLLAVFLVAAGLAGTLAVVALLRGRPATAAGCFLAAAAGVWAVSTEAVEMHAELNSSRNTCEWIRANLGPEQAPVLFKDYVHSVGFYLGRRVPVAVPGGVTRRWAESWPSVPGGAGSGGLLDDEELVRLARRPSGQWLVVRNAGKRSLDAFAQLHGLRASMRRFAPPVFLALLDAAPPGEAPAPGPPGEPRGTGAPGR
jgi:hypothetical protein